MKKILLILTSFFCLGASAQDLNLMSVRLSAVDTCYGISDSAFVTIGNTGAASFDFGINSMTIEWTITGPVNSTKNLVINSGTIASGANSTFSVSTVDMSVPGTYNLSAHITALTDINSNNDTLTNAHTLIIDTILTVSPRTDTITSPYNSVLLTASSPFIDLGSFIFTELCQYKASTGAPLGGNPSYMDTDDYLEISGIAGNDLNGVTLEIWSGGAISRTVTFGSGTVLSSNGTAIIGLGTGTSSPANFYYSVGGASNSYFSSMAVGYILKSSTGDIIDAAASNSFVFPAGAGVTTADWSGNVSSSSGTWGIRLQGPDLNTNAGWVTSSATFRQDPNTLNNLVVISPTLPVTGLTWDSTGTTVGTNRTISAGPFTTSGDYVYHATLNTVCGTYTDSSIITVNLTNASITSSNVCLGTATVTASGGDAPYTYLWDNGAITNSTTALTPGVHYVTVTDNNGWPAIDSVIIVQPSSSTISPTVCNSYLSPSGKTFTTTNTYMDTIPNYVMCDSVITINLVIDTLNAAVTNNVDTITAVQTGATYQWLQCDNNYSIITNDTNQMFIAITNGNYAVQITNGSCVDTSACIAISAFTGINELTSVEYSIYPNPTNGLVHINLGDNNGAINYTISTIEGRIVNQESNVTTNKMTINLNNESKGIYFLKIENNTSTKVYKIIRK